MEEGVVVFGLLRFPLPVRVYPAKVRSATILPFQVISLLAQCIQLTLFGHRKFHIWQQIQGSVTSLSWSVLIHNVSGHGLSTVSPHNVSGHSLSTVSPPLYSRFSKGTICWKDKRVHFAIFISTNILQPSKADHVQKLASWHWKRLIQPVNDHLGWKSIELQNSGGIMRSSFSGYVSILVVRL